MKRFKYLVLAIVPIAALVAILAGLNLPQDSAYDYTENLQQHITCMSADGSYYSSIIPDPFTFMDSWEVAQRYDMLKFVEPPAYVPENFELKFMFLEYPVLIAYYGYIGEEYEECVYQSLTRGFILVYGEEELRIISNALESSELTKIMESMPFDTDEYGLKINSKIIR